MEGSRSGGRFRLVLALGTAQTLAWASTYYLPAILAVPIARDLGLSTGMVFAAFSAALVVAAVAGPFAGRRIDIFGGRDVLALSSLVFASGLVMLAVTEGMGMLFAAWLVIGAGMAMGLYEAAFSTLAGIYGRHARGAMTGITLLAGLASTVGWPISALLDAEFGWRAACLFWAGAHILLGLPLNRLFIPRARQRAPAPAHAPSDASTVDPGGRAMVLLAFVFAVTWFTSTAMAAHLPRLLQEAGASPSAAVAAAALVGPAQVGARLLEFSLLQRYHPLLSARLAAATHPVGALVVIALGAPATVLFAIFHGAGNGILTIAKGTLPLAIFGPRGYGLRQGLLMVPARFGQAAAPVVFAILIERFGASALFLSAGLGLAGFAALFLLPRSAMTEPA